MTIDVLQRKIKTTNDLRDIVTTMKTMSSASIGQYERAAKVLEKYRQNIQNAFHALALQDGLPIISHQQNSIKRYLFLMIGSDNGMVGKFNKEIVELADAEIKNRHLSKKDVLLITVGRRIATLAEQAKYNIYAGYGVSNSVKVINSLAESLILKLDKVLRQERINHVTVFYHQRMNNMTVSIKKQDVLPFDFSRYRKLKNKAWGTNNIPQTDISSEQLFTALMNEIIMIGLAEKLNASLAAEHFVRMTNMQNAEKNIDENLEQLNLAYQQQRQEEITDELIDVVSGAEALKKKV
jgi:F-type H+-transporting ATPase subunit gamma